MKLKSYLAAAAASVALAAGGFAGAASAATTLYYGGDFDPSNPNANGLTNELDNNIIFGAATYDNFTVSGKSWDVTGLYTNDLSSLTNITSANWEIRSGVSEGNGGTLLFSGSATPVVTSTGRSDFGFNEIDVEVPVSFVLAPGTYWLSVQPVAPDDTGRSFNSNTFGLNAVGTHTAGDDFLNSAFFVINFANANSQAPPASGDFSTFSSGVLGTLAAVPEPATWAMMLFGLGGVGAGLRTTRRKNAMALGAI